VLSLLSGPIIVPFYEIGFLSKITALFIGKIREEQRGRRDQKQQGSERGERRGERGGKREDRNERIWR
jgi:hypothetical protein